MQHRHLTRPTGLDLPRLLGPRTLPGTQLLPLLDLQLPDPVPDLTQLPLQPLGQGPVLVQVGYALRSLGPVFNGLGSFSERRALSAGAARS
ncbi:hypothetical protein ACFTXM_14565 [Streptomyces sp. NPDC056930]|uniref:hypothetical protein n=1 Tax=Streptomyces sp. NPDC056930 TaxID=3345967 RepID=UPI00362CA82C